MDASSKTTPRKHNDAGVGMMETIVGVLVALIVGSVLLHVVRLGYEMYKLNSATNVIAEELQSARQMATTNGRQVSVIFDEKYNTFGIDRNGNGRLENIEAEELPSGVNLSEGVVVKFTRTGSLSSGSKEPHIIVSNTRDSRGVSVSSLGAIEID